MGRNGWPKLCRAGKEFDAEVSGHYLLKMCTLLFSSASFFFPFFLGEKP